MSKASIFGLEQEYAILIRNARNFNAIDASFLVVNSYERITGAIWDYQKESPFLDARGFSLGDQRPAALSKKDNFHINNLLPNGARFYVDHAHPEFSTAECSSVLDLIAFDRAGDRILEIARLEASKNLKDGDEVEIYKNNSDHKGNSYGSHENYLVSKDLFERLFPDPKTHSHEAFGVLIPFFVSRQIFTGAGKTGSENGTAEVDFQLTQRADFFETNIGANTTTSRPLLNTRDEPHADKNLYRRLHVIIGDANMSEVATFLKIGTTKLLLSMLEDRFIQDDFRLQVPVQANIATSHDITLKTTIRLENGKKILPLEMQERFLEIAVDYCSRAENSSEENSLILEHWQSTLAALRHDPMSLNGVLDWVSKYALMERQIRRKELSWKHPRIRKMDISYHDINPKKGLYFIMEKENLMQRMLDNDERIKHFINEPPENTRAYFRAHCLRKFGDDIVEANWDVLHFRSSSGSIVSVPLLHPMRGDKGRVQEILEKSESVDDLIRFLE